MINCKMENVSVCALCACVCAERDACVLCVRRIG